MSDTVITAENLGKKYLLRHQRRARYTALRDVIADKASGLFRRARSGEKDETREEFWALRDVNFEVKRGEVLGIIGRNGAGKSTLLKILSRITEPTTGRVRIKGRVASLLEVGTGFHPELTGRENIFLNGAILGMARSEIKTKFDEIVAFAEVEKFLDTPVKRYSSGMYVRLAFAVAAHLEPEILVIDEVLAVGDAEFQRKCLGKMEEVSRGGRTVLFVSHNMAAVEGLCSSALLISDGGVILRGAVEEVVRTYLNQRRTDADAGRLSYRHRGSAVKIRSIELLSNGIPANTVQAGLPCTFRLRYHALTPAAIGRELSISIMLFSNGQKLVNLWTNYRRNEVVIQAEGVVDCRIDKWPFRSHIIQADVYTHIGAEVQDWIEESLRFDSSDGDFYNSGIITNADQGIMFLDHSWSVPPGSVSSIG
jgi:lipopolysaccharide transport system ATP-binding protein